VIERLNDAEGIAAYELNVSCPNVHAGGMAFGADAGSLEYLVVARRRSEPAADCEADAERDIDRHMARVAADSGADAVSVANTFLAMAINAEERKPRLSNVTGGLSGPAINPSRCAWFGSVAGREDSVVGMGGIVTPADAVEFLLAGATAIQVGQRASPIRARRNGWRRARILVQEPRCGEGGQPDGSVGSAGSEPPQRARTARWGPGEGAGSEKPGNRD